MYVLQPLLAQVQQQADQGLVVLTIVLNQLSLEDKDLLCKLLCCSKATAAVVNQTCAGQLTVKTHHIYSAVFLLKRSVWLAKHAPLLRVLHVDINNIDDEEWIAAGLRAAAGVPSMHHAAAAAGAAASQRILQAEAAAQQAVLSLQSAASTADVRGSSVEPQQQAGVSMLRLQELQLWANWQLQGTLLSTMSGCCSQLTRLHLFHVGFGRLSPADLSPLHSLQALAIMCEEQWTAATLPSIRSLTQLTMLQTEALKPDSFKHLPVSLATLIAVTPAGQVPSPDDLVREPVKVFKADLSHLTSLTYLQLDAAPSSQQLPAKLQVLNVRDFVWDEGFLQLQQLCMLKFYIYWHWSRRDAVPDLAPLTALTQLTDLRLSVITTPDDTDMTLPELCNNLSKLPLVELKTVEMGFSPADVLHLGCCTQLTGLTINGSILDCSIGVFAKQLLKLQDLERFSLVSVRFTPRTRRAKDTQPLINAIAKLCSQGELCEVELTTQLLLSSQQSKKLRGLLGDSLTLIETWSDDEYESEDDYSA